MKYLVSVFFLLKVIRLLEKQQVEGNELETQCIHSLTF